jgi:hypothetical protein
MLNNSIISQPLTYTTMASRFMLFLCSALGQVTRPEFTHQTRVHGTPVLSSTPFLFSCPVAKVNVELAGPSPSKERPTFLVPPRLSRCSRQKTNLLNERLTSVGIVGIATSRTPTARTPPPNYRHPTARRSTTCLARRPTRRRRTTGSWISTSRFAMLIPSPSAPCTTDSDSTGVHPKPSRWARGLRLCGRKR